MARATAVGLDGAGGIEAIAAWQPSGEPTREMSFRPSRVLLRDFTGVPAIVDLAAMRDATPALGGVPARIDPLHSRELVIDHSVQVDEFGTSSALRRNAELSSSGTASGMPFCAGDSARSTSAALLGLTGAETFAVTGLAGGGAGETAVTAVRERGDATRFRVRVRVDTPREREYLGDGRILPYALRGLLRHT